MPAVELAEKGFALSAGAGALAQSRGRRRDGEVSGVGRGVRQAGRRRSGSPATRSCCATSAARCARSRRRARTRSTPAGSPTASPRRWRANGGLISKRDLAAYQAKMRTPIRGKYRGYEIITHAAAEQRRRRDDRDAQHSRALRSAEAGRACRRTRCTTRSKRCAAAISIARATSAIRIS